MHRLVIACAAAPMAVAAIAVGAWRSPEPVPANGPEAISLKADRLDLAPVAAIEHRWQVVPELAAFADRVITPPPTKAARPPREKTKPSSVCAKGRHWYSKRGYRYWRCRR
jgi:hypothetical protein